MLDDNPFKKLTLLESDGCRRVRKPKLRWMDGIEGASCERMKTKSTGPEGMEKCLDTARAQTGL
jgi:hypothetical protein